MALRELLGAVGAGDAGEGLVNRRERRARRASAASKGFPPGYLRACGRLDALVGALVLAGESPRFALPPRGIALLAGLDQIGHRAARNDAAHALVTAACASVSASDGPTVVMLRAVLEHHGLAIDEVSLEELGIAAGGMS